MKNLTSQGYKGAVYPVNPNKSQIHGLKAYSTVDKLPETVDLAVIATPAKTVPSIMEQCGKAGIIGLIVISAGFKEIGPEGRELEERILKINSYVNNFKRFNWRCFWAPKEYASNSSSSVCRLEDRAGYRTD